MNARLLPVLILATGLRTSPLAAQTAGPSLRFQPYPAYLGRGPTRLPAFAAADPDSARKIPKTYWKEGALIGGIPLALLGAYAGNGFCQESETAHSSCLLNALGGALMGAWLGGLIGGLAGSFVSKD